MTARIKSVIFQDIDVIEIEVQVAISVGLSCPKRGELS